VQRAEPKKNWVLTTEAFDRLLTWLDEGRASNGERYLEMRRRLVAYFYRKNCSTPDELADETLNRVARRLTEQAIDQDENPAKYCYIVARFVFLEYLRGSQKNELALNELRNPQRAVVIAGNDENALKEHMLGCLEKCLDALEPLNREIIVRYYLGEERSKIENRQALAESLGLTTNALAIRACRIRDKLETCVENCIDE